jgi:hypothetical protein
MNLLLHGRAKLIHKLAEKTQRLSNDRLKVERLSFAIGLNLFAKLTQLCAPAPCRPRVGAQAVSSRQSQRTEVTSARYRPMSPSMSFSVRPPDARDSHRHRAVPIRWLNHRHELRSQIYLPGGCLPLCSGVLLRVRRARFARRAIKR